MEVRNGVTIVTKEVTFIGDGSCRVRSIQNAYIEDASTGTKYYLITSSLGFEDSPRRISANQPFTFYEVYPALPSSVTTINIGIGQSYYARNVRIR